MVTGRHVAGIMAGGGLGSGKAGRDGGATVISAAEQLDWNAWSPLEGGAQIAQGARVKLPPLYRARSSAEPGVAGQCFASARPCRNDG